jgi:S1-C subfamily serine protease
MLGTNQRMKWPLVLLLGSAMGAAGYFHFASGAPPAPQVATVSPPVPPVTPSELSTTRAVSRTFAAVATQVGPSVVRISVAKNAHRDRKSPFRFFDDGGPRMRGLGSGIVIDRKGHILTNHHVISGADEVRVTFSNGKSEKGKVVGSDPRSDLAVIEVTPNGAPPARLGDSDRMRVGEYVLAIGNPFGLDHTVTVGVLSAKNRAGFETGQYEDFLQTDASINPGNSGGPLCNVEGEVIGINAMIAGIGTRIGFAVPSSMAMPIVEQLLRDGKVVRPFLGVDLQDMSPDLAEKLGRGAPESGALVASVKAGSPAQRAGVKPGDVLLTIDTTAIESSRDAQRAVLKTKVGQKLKLELWRDGKRLSVNATTVELPPVS